MALILVESSILGRIAAGPSHRIRMYLRVPPSRARKPMEFQTACRPVASNHGDGFADVITTGFR